MIPITHKAVVKSRVVRAMRMPGTAPTHGPMSGMTLNIPATIPTMSQKGRSIRARPTETMTPTMTATMSWPRKKPPMARFNRVATTRISSRDPFGTRDSATWRRRGRSTSR